MAVVGAPNVGKSSLVNRILGRRQAVVSERAGTTRDRSYTPAEWAGREFLLVDTGGMEPLARMGMEALVTLQARVAVEEADVILHVVDARTGPTEADAAISRELRRARARVVLAVNKLDNPADDSDRYPFYALGEGEPHAISAIHGLGTGDLLDAVVRQLPERAEEAGAEEAPGIAIVGRPNVGKSTLLNRLLGEERAVVSEVAGTTTDAVAGEVEGEHGRYVLLDTAGINRSVRRAEGVAYYSSLRTEAAIRRAEVSLLLVDAVEGVVGGDLQIARRIEEAGRACGVLINKSDLVDRERVREVEAVLSARMTDLKPRALAISALSGAGTEEVVPFADGLYAAHNRRVPTHEIAEFIGAVVAPPARRPGGSRSATPRRPGAPRRASPSSQTAPRTSPSPTSATWRTPCAQGMISTGSACGCG